MSEKWWEHGCVIEGRPMVNGYSRINVGGARVYAHRYAWEQAHGPIPGTKQIHHLCHNRRCSNVEHLTLVGISEHPRFHPKARPPRCQKCGGEDWYEVGNHRQCRICRRRQRRERYATDADYREKHIRVSNASHRKRDVRTVA